MSNIDSLQSKLSLIAFRQGTHENTPMNFEPTFQFPPHTPNQSFQRGGGVSQICKKWKSRPNSTKLEKGGRWTRCFVFPWQTAQFEFWAVCKVRHLACEPQAHQCARHNFSPRNEASREGCNSNNCFNAILAIVGLRHRIRTRLRRKHAASEQRKCWFTSTRFQDNFKGKEGGHRWTEECSSVLWDLFQPTHDGYFASVFTRFSWLTFGCSGRSWPVSVYVRICLHFCKIMTTQNGAWVRKQLDIAKCERNGSQESGACPETRRHLQYFPNVVTPSAQRRIAHCPGNSGRFQVPFLQLWCGSHTLQFCTGLSLSRSRSVDIPATARAFVHKCRYQILTRHHSTRTLPKSPLALRLVQSDESEHFLSQNCSKGQTSISCFGQSRPSKPLHTLENLTHLQASHCWILQV